MVEGFDRAYQITATLKKFSNLEECFQSHFYALLTHNRAKDISAFVLGPFIGKSLPSLPNQLWICSSKLNDANNSADEFKWKISSSQVPNSHHDGACKERRMRVNIEPT